MGIVSYIFRIFWREASVIARICWFVIFVLPTVIGAATGLLGVEWSGTQLPWWSWFGLAGTLVLVALLSAVAKHAYRIDQDIKPRLRISLGTGDPYEMTQRSKEGKITVRRVRVCLQNMGAERLDNCRVLLDEMVDYTNAFCPIPLKQMNDDPLDPLNQPHRQEFTLNPRDRQFIDIAEFHEGKPDTEPIRLCYATEGHRSHPIPNSIPQGRYTLVLKATASKGDPSYQRCELSTKNGQLTIRDVSPAQ